MDATPQPDSKPGKIRTWWHPLLASFLRWQLGSHYQLEEEVPVGQKPLQIDVLLVRKEEGNLPVHAQQILAGLAEYFNDITLLEFKSPSDTLRAGDLQTFLAYALLYRAQNEPLLAPNKMHLLVLAPRVTKAYREELQALAVTVIEEQPGIWSLQGGPVNHRMWVLETAVLAGLEHPLLTLFSPQFLQQGKQVYAQLRAGGYTELVVYLAQQIQQFQLRGEEFAMQHLGTEDEMQQALLDIVASLPPKQRLAGLSPKELLASLSPKELLASLSPKELLASLSPEVKEALRRQLQGDASPFPAE
jgi:hypothetical protein